MTPSLSTLVEEIQSDAVHQEVELSTVLRKCKVLASHIDSTQLEQWSTCEVLGYPPGEPLPDYRIWPLRLKGEFAGPFGRSKTAPIPLDSLPSSVRSSYAAYECRQSLTNIDDFLTQAEDGTVGVDSGDLYKVIGRKMFRGYRCVKVTAEFSAACLTEVQNAVRDRVISATLALMQNQREREAQLQDDYGYGTQPNAGYDGAYDRSYDERAAYRYDYQPPQSYDSDPGSGMVLRSQIEREAAQQADAWARARRGER